MLSQRFPFLSNLMPYAQIHRDIRPYRARLCLTDVGLGDLYNGEVVNGLRHPGPSVEDDRVVLGAPRSQPAQHVLNILSDLVGGLELEQFEIPE